MEKHFLESTESLLAFIKEGATAFHAVDAICKRLDAEGFEGLYDGDARHFVPGGKYYITRNRSSVIAFQIPSESAGNFMISASHTDSPMLKVKPGSERVAFNRYVRLNTEIYGGTILSSWLDRPLTLAGRVILMQNGKITTRLLSVDRDLLLIPNVAIHLNRNVNAGYAFNPAVDMLPLFSEKGEEGSALQAFLAMELACNAEEILGYDLYVVNHTPGSIWGADSAFFSAPRIDNLMCAYATLNGFLQAGNQPHAVTVYYAADNEETGSATKQGAASVFLSDVLDQICESLSADKRRMLASSMMVSADNGHAMHPSHPELSDAENAPHLNGGVVIKYNAAQKYTTDAISAAIFKQICNRADVPTQRYANRSDLPGGSTLGSLSNVQVPLMTVDIGMAQLAMHSAYETAGVQDTHYLISAMREFYKTKLSCTADGEYHIIDEAEGD